MLIAFFFPSFSTFCNSSTDALANAGMVLKWPRMFFAIDGPTPGNPSITSCCCSFMLKVFLFIFIAPALGFIGALLLTVLILNLFRKSNPASTNNLFSRLQLLSSFFYSVGHGTNDAQKTMGVITVLLFSTGMIPIFHVPQWVIISSYAAISLGTYLGGWRIVKTMGTGITKLRPMEGSCAASSGGLVLVITAMLGIPVSTTHVIAGSIMGVGAVENFKTVRWITARKMIWAWVLTIPASALISAGFYAFLHLIFI